ncbi:hypothetical protein J5226_22895 [Lysobacter sp. K5869]|uniref:hypothetical protein n=1 Tax=Lysobacter sp. K5869 TaxID=2820808 RepID=UPI001C062C90|nr:hypothetical protein [Lysobacter sp. K5869]QWP76399.1 hypothetical protein J5226_22895 [Lysobacter sp. K5869]
MSAAAVREDGRFRRGVRRGDLVRRGARVLLRAVPPSLTSLFFGHPTTVIPAKAGTHFDFASALASEDSNGKVKMGSGFRRNDGGEESEPILPARAVALCPSPQPLPA